MPSGKSGEDRPKPVAQKISSVPKRPGVYLFKDSREEVIYVGKAKSLRDRLSSYFRASSGLDERKRAMVGFIRDFSYIVTDNELEALALEANLIKRHKPKYNVILRDDKNYPYLRLDSKSPWPRLEIVRRVKRDGSMYFGPYVPSGNMREALRFINANFGIRPCRYRLDRPMRPCIQHQMGRCPAPCAGLIERDDYMRAVNDVALFLRGRNTELMDGLKKRMLALSGEMRYEEAAKQRDSIDALEGAFKSHKVVAPELGDLDVVGLYADGIDAAFEVFFIRAGIMTGAREFFLKGKGDLPVPELLYGFFESFYGGGLIPVGTILAQSLPDGASEIEQWLAGMSGERVEIVVPVRGKKRELIEMASENARLHLESRKNSSADDVMEELAERLKLDAAPLSIGAFDISNLSGTEPVGAFVLWADGGFGKTAYRHVKIRSVEGPNDFAMMEEAVARVMCDIEPPDLVLIDGGLGQLEYARRALVGIDHAPRLIALAKDPDRIYADHLDEPVRLDNNLRSSLLLRKIRDEAHRFAISYHKRLRARRMMASPLEGVRGIGRKRRLALLKAFSGMEAIRAASVEELSKVKGMDIRAARALREALDAK